MWRKKLPHYSDFPYILSKNDEYANIILTISGDFINEYIDEHLWNLEDKKKIIKEYTVARWIKLIACIESSSIYEYFLDNMDDMVNEWLYHILSEVINIYQID